MDQTRNCPARSGALPQNVSFCIEGVIIVRGMHGVCAEAALEVNPRGPRSNDDQRSRSRDVDGIKRARAGGDGLG
ncbi:MAG: hypothetical protein ACOC0P_03585, partial [Planctomycetota bacterium]